jgi:hypothetical protein
MKKREVPNGDPPQRQQEVPLRRRTFVQGVQVGFHKLDPNGEAWHLTITDVGVLEQTVIPLNREAVAALHDETAGAKIEVPDALVVPQGRPV